VTRATAPDLTDGPPAVRDALVDLLARIVGAAVHATRLPPASDVRSARLALEELAAMAKGLSGPYSACAGHTTARAYGAATAPVNDEDVRRLARAASLPEIDALDFRCGNGQARTVSEAEAWARLLHFAALVARATAAATSSTSSTPGAGPAAAIRSPATRESNR
jgi:hypothetical protein